MALPRSLRLTSELLVILSSVPMKSTAASLLPIVAVIRAVICSRVRASPMVAWVILPNPNAPKALLNAMPTSPMDWLRFSILFFAVSRAFPNPVRTFSITSPTLVLTVSQPVISLLPTVVLSIFDFRVSTPCLTRLTALCARSIPDNIALPAPVPDNPIRSSTPDAVVTLLIYCC